MLLFLGLEALAKKHNPGKTGQDDILWERLLRPNFKAE